MTERTKINECYLCAHRRPIPGDCHSCCAAPSDKQLIDGSAHGKARGWFSYPYNFDPVWKGSLCDNFKEK